MNKSPLKAMMLSFIPGAGHAYWGRPVRTVLYGGAFLAPLGLLLLMIATNSGSGGMAIFLLCTAALAWMINMIDMIVTLASAKPGGGSPVYGPESAGDRLLYEQHREKTRTMLLSFVPGLGHMSLGLMQRGITLLISYVGLLTIIIFISIIMDTGALLIFLLGLPVIWIYNVFDVVQRLHAKQRGEPLEDRSIFEDLESHIGTGRKNKVLAIALSIFPGAGHLYLGLQMRGLQFMGGFLLAIYIMDNFRLSLFFFLLPLFWSFAFFDAIQQSSRYERGELRDEPVLTRLVYNQRWIGIALFGFGVFFLLDRIASEFASRYAASLYAQYLEIKYMFPTAVVAFVMIAVGLRMIFGSKASAPKQQLPAAANDEEGTP